MRWISAFGEYNRAVVNERNEKQSTGCRSNGSELRTTGEDSGTRRSERCVRKYLKDMFDGGTAIDGSVPLYVSRFAGQTCGATPASGPITIMVFVDRFIPQMDVLFCAERAHRITD